MEWFSDHELAENLILFLASTKERKRDKSEFVTKFVGIIVSIISYHKIFATRRCFTNHLK